eukprot:403341153
MSDPQKLPPSRYKNMMIISHQKQKKRQSNSYSKPLGSYVNQSERNDSVTYHNDSLNINIKNERQSERLRTLDDESSMMDGFFEKKYKNVQQQLLQIKSKLYEKDSQLENAVSELKKCKRDNKLFEEKTKHLDQELQTQTRKKLKYKQIAKQFKQNLDSIEKTLSNLKTLSQEEINQLKFQIKSLKNNESQKKAHYLSNMNTIETYLLRIQKMLKPQDQNFSFNNKILNDLVQLCEQFQKVSLNEEGQKLKVSQFKHNFQKESTNDKSLVDMEFLISQSSSGVPNREEQLLSNKTKRLLDDYEKLRYESENIKLENKQLKRKVASSSLEKSTKLHILSTYDSKESVNRRNQQSLSVGDLTQFDSVQLLNNKLEDKNRHLQQQLDSMKLLMINLTQQTQEIQQEREQFKEKIQYQNQYIQNLISQKAQSISDSQEEQQHYKSNQYNYQIQDVQSEDNYTTQQSNEHRYDQDELRTQKRVFQQNQEQQNIDKATMKLYNPYNLSPTSSDFDQKNEILITQSNGKLKLKENGHVSFNKLNLQQLQSESNSNIISSRGDLHNITSDRQSKHTLDSAQRVQFNVFKRNGYLDSEKDNLSIQKDSNKVSYRQQVTNQINMGAFNYNETTQDKRKETTLRAKNSMPRPPAHLNNTQNLNQQHLISNRDVISPQNIFKNNQRMHSMQTLKRPTSLGSTTTLVMNEKAKALKDEISTLDDEIQALQKNLKRAISKRETKK